MKNTQLNSQVGRLLNALISKNYIKVALIGLAILVSVMASAHDTISGQVVGVADGDTLTVLDEAYRTHKIRLAGIDAPEKAQAFGQIGKQKLAALCYLKQATVEVINTDRYGRTVGDVTCEGIHANEEMVRGGYAWAYRQYSNGFEYLFAIEEQAKLAQLGLWENANPIPPWAWRRSLRSKE